MISFSCERCAAKLRVKDEHAGRMTKCPTCQQAVRVPGPAMTPVSPPVRRGEETIGAAQRPRPDADTSEPTRPSNGDVAIGDGERYVIRGEIARGGMGAVMRAVDRDIRREVALKYMLATKNGEGQARFIEEAQITGQLEHPNIVPVHELGIDANGRVYFTMKLVQGKSLANIFQELEDSPESATVWPLHRLVTVFVGVCHALAYAHSRNVIHRDLKPANIMVGDFGEVYVMDWGLAKVLGESSGSGAAIGPATPSVAAVAGPAKQESGSNAPGRSLVTTDRDGDLTQDGAILGTPAYMAPEQARGDIHALDQRTDVYALGGLLYAILTLRAPVEKAGEYLATLMRVAEGEIQPPEKRTPNRVIPPELSAIAMKALALEPERRYPTVEAMRRDIELYQSGRSVSAKQDSVQEQLVKFVKRNKGFSLATAVSMIVLSVVVGVFLRVNYAARVFAETQQAKAETTSAALIQEQADKKKTIEHALPALSRSARQLAGDGNVEEARSQIELMLAYDPDNAEALLLKAQLEAADEKWDAARALLDRYLRRKTDDASAKTLRELCGRGNEKNAAVWFEVAQLLQADKVYVPATGLLKKVRDADQALAPLLPLYRKQIETQWPGFGTHLRIAKGAFQFGMSSTQRNARAVDLKPLQGIPLGSLTLSSWTKLESIEALRGMPLTHLEILNSDPLHDLKPLKGLPLTVLKLSGCKRIEDIEPLRGLPLRVLNLSASGMADISALRGMKLTSLDLSQCKAVVDLEPLRGMPLTKLNLYYMSRLESLDPLEGMRLTDLNLHFCWRIESLEPLRGMPLTRLELPGSGSGRYSGTSLEPLRGMSLSDLNLIGIDDVSPLEGMELTSVTISPKTVKHGMDVLRRMKSLWTFWINNTRYPAEEFWKRHDAGEFSK